MLKREWYGLSQKNKIQTAETQWAASALFGGMGGQGGPEVKLSC